jgi:hypothetical protein
MVSNGLRSGFPMLILARYLLHSAVRMILLGLYSCTACLQLDVPLPALVVPNMLSGRDVASRNTMHVLAIIVGGRSESEKTQLNDPSDDRHVTRKPGLSLRRHGTTSELIQLGFCFL